jgi:NADH-quinone oxidoreductase subunit D
MPEGPISVKVPRKVPAGEVVVRYEAPRGECIHYVRSNDTDKPDRVKVRAPTMANLMSIRQCLLNSQVADIPIIIAAIDPCFSCTDRMVILARKGEREAEVMEWEELRKRSVDERPL